MSDQYTIVNEPKGDLYRSLLDFAAGCCTMALLVVRKPNKLTPAAIRVLDSLRPHFRNEEQLSRWPGTELVGHTATVITLDFNEHVRRTMARVTSGLYDWLEPEFPEDLCLLRPDGRPWLVSIAHERDAYLDLAPVEYATLVAAVPLSLTRDEA